MKNQPIQLNLADNYLTLINKKKKNLKKQKQEHFVPSQLNSLKKVMRIILRD